MEWQSLSPRSGTREHVLGAHLDQAILPPATPRAPVSAELPNQAADNLLAVLNFNPSVRWGFRFVWVIHMHESPAVSSIQPSKFLGLVDGTWKDPGLRADTIGAFSDTAAASTQRSFCSGGSQDTN